MKANIVDLRYKMKEVIKALDRKERIEITYRGKTKGIIIPAHEHTKKSAREHPLFGSGAKEKRTVAEVMKGLRGGRYNAQDKTLATN